MVLGKIQGHDVIYIPEKDVVFCKNTAISFQRLDKAICSGLVIEKINEKNLVITKENGMISLGCLITNKTNYLQMKSKIIQIKNNGRKENI